MSDNNHLCPRCGQVIPQKPEIPTAVYLSLQTAGRQVFAITGKPGLWIKRPHMTGGVEMDESCTAKIKAGKGRTGVTFYRQKSLEAQLRAVLLEDAAEAANAKGPAK